MKKLPPAGSRSKVSLAEMFVRRLMKDGARGTAEEIFVAAMEIVQRKAGDRTAAFVLEASVENSVLHLYLKWLLRQRASGGPARTTEDFRRPAVSAIVKAAARESAPTMDRRLAAAILKGYTESDPGPKHRTAAHRLSAKRAYSPGR